MKLYLDVCCYNRPFDDQSQSRIHLEAEAVLSILSQCQQGIWQCVAGEVIEMEIGRMPDAKRRQQVMLLLSVCRAYVAIDQRLETRALRLEQMGFHAFDALHLASAESAGADVFLTTDDKMLRNAGRHGTIIKVRVANPLGWLSEVRSR